MCHLNLAVHKDSHAFYLAFVSRISLSDLLYKPAVNLLDNLIDTRKQP